VNPDPVSRTSPANGRLWGARARDWADLQEGQCSAAYEAVFDGLSLGPGTCYCDVGCGAGLAALLASRRGAAVWGVDAAESLLAVARERVGVGDFRLGDLEELPFPDASFDLVTGFNSFQFAANPIAALTEARRVLKPEGRIVVLTWGAPQGMEAATLVMAIKPLLPPPPPGSPGPFALSDGNALKTFAQGAGLTPLAVSDVACEWYYQDLPTALRGLGSSGVAAKAAEHTSVEAVDRAHEAALTPFRRGDGSYRLGASFRWLLAAP
jgi:ubiquinone/menaquinone biosynthesis C-methylase UbiE